MTLAPVATIRDPLDGLVERTAAEAGAPFVPDVPERLAALKKDDRATFEGLRAQLKKSGCRVTARDEAIAGEGGRGPTQADILIDLAQSAELFHAPDAAPRSTGSGGRSITTDRDLIERLAEVIRRVIADRSGRDRRPWGALAKRVRLAYRAEAWAARIAVGIIDAGIEQTPPLNSQRGA